MASWLVRSSPIRAVRVRALVREIVLCSWGRHSHSASLHPAVKMGTGDFTARGNPVMD